MRKQTFLALWIVIAVVVGPRVIGVTAQGTPEPASLVLTVDNGADARLNRMDWDVNAWSLLLPGTSIRGSDYIDLAGRTTVRVLCPDLTVLDQRGSEVPQCNPYPAVTAFFYVDDPAWTAHGQNTAITVLPADIASLPADLDPGSYGAQELSGAGLDLVRNGIGTIQGLDLPDDAKAFALSSLYRSQGALLDAVGVLTALPDIGCTERRPSVDAPTGDARPMVQSPVLYLRLGELYELLGLTSNASLQYQCALDLSNALGDTADAALASARWANIATDPGQAIQFYQQSINAYAQLGAQQDMQAVLDVCGLRNCTPPG